MIKLPFNVDINNLIDDLRVYSWEAADIFLFYSKMVKDSNYKNKIIQSKNSEDPITLADLKVNELIINRIKEKYKDISWEILSEENVKTETNINKKKADWVWVLDPLDGTKDFIQGSGDFAMHLALNFKQKPLMGVILIPDKNELWISNGEKLWCERRDRSFVKTHFSNKKNLQDMTLVTSKNHRNLTLKNLIEKVNFKEVIVMGSIGCKIASIIRGESDIYICLSLPGKSSPKDWDFAAPQAILQAAGGAITDLDNKELSFDFNEKGNYNQGGIIVASNNKQNHKHVCSQIKQIIQKYNICSV